jgi:hypothetical protein
MIDTTCVSPAYLDFLMFNSDRAYFICSVNLQDSAGKCDELRAVKCIMPCDRRQVKVVAGL